MDQSKEFENEFKVFSNSGMNVTNRQSKISKWGHLCSFHVPFLSYDPKIVEKSAFIQFCADISKKV